MAKLLEGYTLYVIPWCPFCIKVDIALMKMGLKIKKRNRIFPSIKKELVAGGGKPMVPCLVHPDGTWQYESSDIIDFLQKLEK